MTQLPTTPSPRSTSPGDSFGLERDALNVDLALAEPQAEAKRARKPPGARPPQRSRGQGFSWRLRSTLAAFALGTLPVLVVGTSLYVMGRGILPRWSTRADREAPAAKPVLVQTLAQQRRWLEGLSLGTGALAIAAGSAAAVLTWKHLAPVASVAATTRGTANRLRLEGDRGIEGDDMLQLRHDASYIAAQLPELMWQREARAEQYGAIATLEERLRLVSDADAVFAVTVETVRKLLEADRVSVFCFDDDGEGTFVAESVAAGYPKALRAIIHDPCFNEGYSERYRQGRVLAIDDIYNAGLTDCHIGLLERFAVKANLVGPLMQRDRLFGLLIVHQCDGPRQWSSSDIDLMKQVSGRVGLALSFAERVRAVAQTSAFTAQLDDLAAQLHGMRDESAIFQQATTVLQQALDIDKVVAISIDDRDIGHVAGVSMHADVTVDAAAMPADIQFVAAELESFRAGHINTESCEFTEVLDERTRDAACLSAPVLYQGRLLGILSARQHLTERVWTPAEIELARHISAQTGRAIDMARVLQESDRERRDANERAERESARADTLHQQCVVVFGNDTLPNTADLEARSRQIETLQQQVLELVRASRDTIDLDNRSGPVLGQTVSMASEQLQNLVTSAHAVATTMQSAERHRYRVNQALDTSRDAIELVSSTFDIARDMSAASSQQIDILDSYATTIATVTHQILHFVEQMELSALNAQTQSLPEADLQTDHLTLAHQIGSTTRRLVSAAAELEPLLDNLQVEARKASTAVANSTQQIVSGTHLMTELKQDFERVSEANQRLHTLMTDAISVALGQVQAANVVSQTVTTLATSTDIDRAEPVLDATDKLTKLTTLSRELQVGLEQLKVRPQPEDVGLS